MKPFGEIQQITPAGINGIILTFCSEDALHTSRVIEQWCDSLSQNKPSWLQEWVPSYCTLYLCFDISMVDHHFVYQYLRQLTITQKQNGHDNKCHELPVWYGQTENDLARIAKITGLSEQDIITRHSALEYRVYAVGFAPGFGYLGDIDPLIAVSRLEKPRKRVPKGAVAIADQQTAIYPMESPGGWNILGLCPVAMFSKGGNSTSLLKVGDTVKFTAISQAEYEECCRLPGGIDA